MREHSRSEIYYRVPYWLLIQFTGCENFILAMYPRFRETSHLEKLDWSKWIWAMAPEDTPRVENLEKRGEGHVGFKNKKLAVQLAEENPRIGALCGIYEWKVTGDGEVSPRVVYVGSTCANRQGQRMENRIVGYTQHGNHKRDLINDALRKGCELWVRFKPTRDEDEAMKEEDKLLSRYNYAWNIRNNGLRPILEKAENWM